MAWPTDDIVTSNLDSSADSAASARANLYTALLRIKDIIAGRNTANGVCPLDSGSKVPVANIPALSYLPSTGGTVSGATTFGSTLAVTGAVTFSSTLQVASNITVTSGAITASANYVKGAKNSQTGYSSAGLMSESTTGDVHIAWHASGASAITLGHVRGSSYLQLMDYLNVPADLRLRTVYAGVGNTDWCYLTADATASFVNFDNTDYLYYNRSTNTWQFVIGSTPYLVASVSGFYPQTNNTLGIGTATQKWLTGYITTLNYDNLVDFSDKRFKTHIENLGGQWSGPLIDRLQPVRYTWTESGRMDIGFYAQDVAEVLPEATMPPSEESDTWGMQPDKLITLLVAEIKDLRRRVAALEAK